MIFDGGLDIELGKAEVENCVNRGETKVKSIVKENTVYKKIHCKGKSFIEGDPL